MADNVLLNLGSGGETLATDDIGGIQYQLIKLSHGALNSATIVSLTSGLPIQNDDTDLKITLDSEAVVLGAGTAEFGKLAAGVAEIGNVKNAGTFAVQIDAAAVTSLALIDDVVATDDTTTHATGTTKGVNIMAAATPTDGSVAANDIGMLAMSTDRRLHVDADITASVALDVSAATVPVSNAGLTELAAAINSSKLDIDIASSTVDVMLGTDFSGVLGTTSLITTTQADTIANTIDTVNVSAFLYGFNGTTWDRMDGDATNGLLVNLGGNNDVTNAGTFVVQEDGAALTALQLIDNIVHTEDDASGGAAVGASILAVRDDSLSALTPVEGDYVPLRVGSTGALHVTGGGGGTEYTQDEVHADPATAATFLMARDDVLSTQETADGDWTLPRANARGAQWVEIDGTNALDVSAATLTVAAHAVTNAGTFVVQEDGAALTALQLIDNPVFVDDAAFTLTSSSVSMAGAIRDDALSTLTAVEGDAVPLRVGSTGALHVTGSAGVTEFNEDTAHSTGALGNLSLVVRRDANTTLVNADGDYAPLQVDADGKLKVEIFDGGDTLTVGSHAVTNAGTFAVQIVDTSFAVADGNALGEGVLIQGDDGTDRKNINVDATTGDVQVDVTNTVTVDGSGVTQPVSGTVTANLSATDNAVLDDIAAKLAPNTTNGHTPYLNQDTSAIATVKGSAGTIYWISCMSIDATPVYLNLYDSTTATLGSTTPTNQFIVPTQGDANGAGFTINFGPLGIQYGTGIQVAAATTFNGSTDPGTNVVITNIGFE